MNHHHHYRLLVVSVHIVLDTISLWRQFGIPGHLEPTPRWPAPAACALLGFPLAIWGTCRTSWRPGVQTSWCWHRTDMPLTITQGEQKEVPNWSDAKQTKRNSSKKCRAIKLNTFSTNATMSCNTHQHTHTSTLTHTVVCVCVQPSKKLSEKLAKKTMKMFNVLAILNDKYFEEQRWGETRDEMKGLGSRRGVRSALAGVGPERGRS